MGVLSDRTRPNSVIFLLWSFCREDGELAELHDWCSVVCRIGEVVQLIIIISIIININNDNNNNIIIITLLLLLLTKLNILCNEPMFPVSCNPFITLAVFGLKYPGNTIP